MALGSALAILTVVPASLATASATAPRPSRMTDTAGGRPDALRTVTLITGDTVTVTADGAKATHVEGPQGQGVDVDINKVGKDTYVYPDSALPFVSAGLLDKSLFNVTRLLADGYDDAHTNSLPLLVSYTDNSSARAQALPTGATKLRTLSSIRGAALTEKRDKANDFWSGLTGASTAQGATRAAADPSPPSPTASPRCGWTGR
ncbi:hypothetical protein ACFQ51_42655 [Streptomyces kaempferi]